MDDIHSLLYRQNENLKRLESALKNAMNRIETIEKLYIENDNKNIKVVTPFTTKETESYNFFEPLTPKNLDLVNKEILNLDCISIIPDCNSNCESDIKTISRNTSGKNEDVRSNLDKNNKDKILQTDISFEIDSLDNSDLSFKENFFYKEKMEKLLESENQNKNGMFFDKSINTNSASTIPNTPISTETNIFKEIKHFDNLNTTPKVIKSNSNNTISNGNAYKQDFKQAENNGMYSNEIKVAALKLGDISNCFIKEGSTFFSDCLGKNTIDDVSNRHYLSDDEENSNSKQGSLDLENEENEFYYLKDQAKRGSMTYRERSNINILETDHSTRYKNFPLSARLVRKDELLNKNTLNNKEYEHLNLKSKVKEIRYHRSREKIVGYVQIPYCAFVNQYPINSNTANYAENKVYSEKNANFPQFQNSAKRSIYSNVANSFIQNYYSYPIIRNNPVISINNARLIPNFYRFNSCIVYPLFLRPYYYKYVLNC